MAWISARATKDGNVIGVFEDTEDGDQVFDICHVNQDFAEGDPGRSLRVSKVEIPALIAVLREVVQEVDGDK